MPRPYLGASTGSEPVIGHCRWCLASHRFVETAIDWEPLYDEELVATAEAIDSVSLDDPVRMYLKEIGRVALLRAEQEVDGVFACIRKERQISRTGTPLTKSLIVTGRRSFK